MVTIRKPVVRLSLAAAALATATAGFSAAAAAPPAAAWKIAPTTSSASSASQPALVEAKGAYNLPWALAFAPGTRTLFITEKPGTMKFYDTATGIGGAVSGLPAVAYEKQGGLGDLAFLPSEASATLERRTIYLTWAEAGPDNTRGTVLGRGKLTCPTATACRIDNLAVLWRAAPKTVGPSHFSYRIAISPDERYVFVSSGERQLKSPAQDLGNTLGKIVRLNINGKAALGNPFNGVPGQAAEIWTYGNRNILGLQFDAAGRLWGLEHGPMGGDELNLLQRGGNYGWPLVSDGDDYDGTPIPRHATRPEFVAPAISWNPVIAPGGFLFYRGTLFQRWQGNAIIAGMRSKALIRVVVSGGRGTEIARYPFSRRLRGLVEGGDGALWVIEDAADGRLLKVTPG